VLRSKGQRCHEARGSRSPQELVWVSEPPSGNGALEREASPEPWMLTGAPIKQHKMSTLE
jgi:hypothetical protein